MVELNMDLFESVIHVDPKTLVLWVTGPDRGDGSPAIEYGIGKQSDPVSEKVGWIDRHIRNLRLSDSAAYRNRESVDRLLDARSELTKWVTVDRG